MRTVRVFISSPGDVNVERQRVQRVIERLNGEYANVARFEAVRWETRFYGAHAGFQDEIPEARDCDVVIGILWSRMGTPLPESFACVPAEHAKEAEERYPSGTAYELLSSIFERRSRAAGGKPERPDVYVFRKTAPAVIALGDAEGISEAQLQWQQLEQFFERWFRARDGVFRAAFHTFVGVNEFEKAAEALLRGWIREHLEGAAAIVWPANKGSPFRGLAAFDAAHAPVFFGRDRKVGRAIEVLKDAAPDAAAIAHAQPGARDRHSKAFLLLVGPSGSGKSSLMLAGLAPRLTAPGVVPQVEQWRTAVMRPSDGASPQVALAEALLRSGTSDESRGFGAALPALAGVLGTSADLARLMLEDEQKVVDAVIGALDAVGDEEGGREGYERRLATNLLLLVDQLEEVFSGVVDDTGRTRFATMLSALASTGRVWVVATLRGDLYERLISERAWIALKDAGATYDLAPPGPEELEEIVRKSATAAGLQYEEHPETGARLDEQLLRDASGQDILPLLQFTLNRLYDEREVVGGDALLTWRSYEGLGGLDGAIDQAAEQALKSLAEVEKAALPRLLRLMAVPVGDDAPSAGSRAGLAIRPVKSGDVRRDPATAKLADALVDARILLASRADTNDGALLRVAHQRVFESWRRAREIVAEQRDFYRIRDDVEKQHQRWQTGKRSRQLLVPPGVAIAEAEKIASSYREELPDPLLNFISASGRRARWRHRALVSATVVFAIVAAVAGWQRNEAVVAQASAESNYKTARGTVDGLIKSFAGRLSQMQGITIETIEAAFNEIKRSVDDLGARSAATDPTFDKTRADLTFEFARTYKKVESPRAVEIAEEGLRLLRGLADRFPDNVEYKLAISNSYELLSDLKRTGDPKGSWQAVEAALATRRALATERSDDPERALSLSKILVRAGDLETQVNRNFAAATKHYDEVLDISLRWWLLRPDDQVWQRELSWALSKYGDQRLRAGRASAPAAVASFQQELCLRRRLHEGDVANTLIQADVSWSLDRLGRALQMVGNLAGAEEAFVESIGLRRALLNRDPRNEVWLRDLYAIVTRFGLLLTERQAYDVAFAYLSEAQRLHLELRSRNALQNWLPRFAEGQDKARVEIGGYEAAETLRSLDAVINREEGPRVMRFLVRRPTAAECWGDLTAGLSLLAASRLPVGTIDR